MRRLGQRWVFLWVSAGLLLVAGLLTGCVATRTAKPTPAAGSGQKAGSARGTYALVYDGPVAAEGAAEAAAAIAKRSGLPVKYVSDITNLPLLLKGARVFIIGGTEDNLNPLLDAFTPEITSAVRAYLRSGGRYLGFCGGGFMASTGWEEEDGFVETLGIIPAESGDFDRNYDPRLLPVRWLGETRLMYFQAGPTFDIVDNSEDVRVIARYRDGRIAALISSYGRGKVAVTGPHPEAPLSWGDEIADRRAWTPSTGLAVDLLKELLSNRPIKH